MATKALPLKLWLPAQDGIPIIGFVFSYSATAFVASWFGMVSDCLTPFLLMMKRTRLIAYFFVVTFHIVTGILFQIGVFPIVMIVLTTIFFSNEFHQQIVTKISHWFSVKIEGDESIITKVHLITKCIVVAYVFVQILLPFRYLLYPGNLYWTEQGYRFSWRVMLMEKAGTATFYVTDSKTGRKGFVDNTMFLNTHQEKQMSFQPDMILQFSKYLQQQYQKMGVYNPKVTAEIFVTLNGRPSELFIDSTVDLSKIEDSFEHKSWILPFKENK